ncbi:PREDICTED: zinc finger protein ZAT9-like [Camelina sativa]|uniref:Zinc finger protein ZAT9-like n=1 Tax=Camelina sativa TaxID=90675 RepID=A0ABM0UEU2_CAMSA|nr:PREDICTED: zinc finger protein ZAT9-like [Camelina sativa]XP_010449743.1 PREDICTED: zinc finger protein ZAT9-like [Camelina sativa]
MQNKHKCKLCSKSFCNGRALGGHMKSHLVSSQPSTRKKLADSVHSSSCSSSDGKSLVYGLRENPRKSFRVFNPDPESSTVYNSETETEPESGSPVKKRVRAEVSKKKKKKKKSSKRVCENSKKQKTSHESPEPASSVSDGSPEQDLAMCLMMLSRDSRELEIKPVFASEVVEETKPEKIHFPELRRCMIDLNLPPPQETEAVTVVSAI